MSSSQIKLGSLISYLLIGLNILLGLIYTPWVLREVGSSNYGVYTVASSLIAIFLMDFGMSSAITRFISKYRAENNQNKINEFVSVGLKIYILLCIILAIVLSIVYVNIQGIYSNLTIKEIEVLKRAYIITAIFVVLSFPVNLCNGILNAFEEYICLKGSDIINRLGTVVVSIIALKLHKGIYAIIFINGLFNFLTLILKCFFVVTRTKVTIKLINDNGNDYKSLFIFSAWTTIRSVSQQMIYNVMPSILAMVTNTLSVTLFGFARVIEGYVYTITQAINGLFLPKISRIVVGEKDAKNTLPLMIRVGRINHSIVVVILIGLAILGQEFVDLWVGKGYESLNTCIIIICLPYFVEASQQIADNSLIALNYVRYPAVIQLVTGVANLLLSYIFARSYGVIGVCFIICITSFLRIVFNNIIYIKVLKIDIVKFFYECHIKLLFPSIITLFAGLVVNSIVPIGEGPRGWLLLGTKIMLICVIYFISMWVLGWNKEEKLLIKSIIKRKQ